MTCSTLAVSWPHSISWLRMSCARDSPINAGSATSRSASTSDNSSSSSLGASAHRQPWSCECTWSGNLHQDATVWRSRDPSVWEWLPYFPGVPADPEQGTPSSWACRAAISSARLTARARCSCASAQALRKSSVSAAALWRCACAPSHADASSCSRPSAL
jgi:hypothetical protein